MSFSYYLPVTIHYYAKKQSLVGVKLLRENFYLHTTSQKYRTLILMLLTLVIQA